MLAGKKQLVQADKLQTVWSSNC